MSKRRPLRIAIIILTVLVALLLGLQFAFQSYLHNSLREIEKSLQEASNYKYRFHFDTIKLRIFKGTVFIAGFRMEATDSLENKSSFSTDHVIVNGAGVFTYIFKKQLTVSEIIINGAQLNFQFQKTADKESTAPKKDFILYDAIKNFANSVVINKIQVSNVDINYFHSLQDSKPFLVSKNSSIIFEDLKIDSVIAFKDRKMFEAERFLIISKGFSITTKDSLYRFSMGQLTLSYNDSILQLDSLKMEPNFNDKQFSKVFGSQTDRMTLSVNKIVMARVSVKALIENRELNAPLVVVEGVRLLAYRDKNFTRIEKAMPTVQQLLRKIPIYLNLDTIQVTNGFIQYRELVKGGKSPGYITFTDLHGSIYNFTNDTLLHKDDLVLTASTKLMGKGDMEAVVKFPYANDGNFSMKGSMSAFQINDLNPMLEPNANILIRNGRITQTDFEFNAGLKFAKGTMTFRYRDLEVEMLDKETKESDATREKIFSLIANNVALVSDNPSEDKPVRTAGLYYERNPNRFVFNYCWKTLLSGIIETVTSKGLKKFIETKKNQVKKKARKDKKNKKG